MDVVRWLGDTLRQISRNKMGLAGLIGLIFFIVLSFVMPAFIPVDTQTRPDQIYSPPSAAHILGTDFQGRDIFSILVHGGRDVLIVAFLTGLISTAIAVTLGALAALLGGAVDMAVTSLADMALAIPQIPLLVVLASLVKLNSVVILALILALLSWPTLTLSIRSLVLSLKQRDYVEAARSLGLGTRHIIFSEILPNMMSYIAISMVLAMTAAVYALAALVVLGLVPLSDNNSWPVTIQLAWTRGAIFFRDSLLNIMAPVMAIALFQLSLVLFSNALEDIFNPRLRTSA
jgi:peptide/nickel transport system permease protein